MIPKKFIISPPFGNYIGHKNATRIMGSYTLYPRSGLFLQAIKTIRPIKGGWVNRMGLRNRGIENIKKFHDNRIYSLAAIDSDDWTKLLYLIPKGIAIELNLSCPNVDELEIIPKHILHSFVHKCSFVDVKLPPSDFAIELIDYGLRCEVKYFHLCNTIPTNRGGESGTGLKEESLDLIQKARKEFGGGIKIIGGGGIYSLDDVKKYKETGADYFSLSTVWFRPWRALKILKSDDFLD